jgi:PqqD family protein of HPr-rel-A system
VPEVSPKVPKVREHLVVVEIDGESVVLDRENGRLHHLNVPASAIFRSCDGQVTQEELVRELAEAFGGPADRIAGDVEAVVGQLRESGLLESDGADGCAGCGSEDGGHRP